jgi:hypothetical protein
MMSCDSCLFFLIYFPSNRCGSVGPVQLALPISAFDDQKPSYIVRRPSTGAVLV